jgi:hypothetical protein
MCYRFFNRLDRHRSAELERLVRLLEPKTWDLGDSIYESGSTLQYV